MRNAIKLATDEMHARLIIKQQQEAGFFLVDARAVERTSLWLWFRTPDGQDPVRMVAAVHRATGNFSEDLDYETQGRERQERTIEKLVSEHERKPGNRGDDIVFVAPATDRVVWLFLGKMIDARPAESPQPRRTMNALDEPEVEREPPREPERRPEPRREGRKGQKPKEPKRTDDLGRLDAAAALAITSPAVVSGVAGVEPPED